MTVMDLSDSFILNIKNNDYRVYISNIDKKEAIIIFKNSNLDYKRVLSMDFKTLSKTFSKSLILNLQILNLWFLNQILLLQM